MDKLPTNLAEFTHIRIIIGMVIGLGVARLLNGLARYVQHPQREEIYSVHLGWSLFMLLSVVHFWWFEFALGRIQVWTFESYLFVIAFAALYFLLPPCFIRTRWANTPATRIIFTPGRPGSTACLP